MRRFLACLVMGLLVAHHAAGWVLPISPGPRSLFLQVGQGAAGVNFPTIAVVSATVPAGTIGRGIPVHLVSDSSQAASPFDGYVVCAPPREVYIGGYFRLPGSSSGQAAQLSVVSPSSLTSGTSLLPVKSISWTSSSIGTTTVDIPSGSFNGGLQILRMVAANTWVEDCMSFDYANDSVLAAGTYTGRVTYQLSSP